MLDPSGGEGMRCRHLYVWKKFLYRLWGMGVIGYMDEKLLDSCCGLRYISDLRCGVCYAFGC